MPRRQAICSASSPGRATALAGSAEGRRLTFRPTDPAESDGVVPPAGGDGILPPPLDGVEPPLEAGLDVGALGQRAVGQLIVRAVVVRAITLVGSIALARLLTPSEFGAFAVITVVVTFLSLLGDFGTSAALIQQDHDPTALELSTAFVTQLVIWGTVGMVIWLVAGALPSLIPSFSAEATGIARLLVVGIFLGALRAVPTVMLSRVLRFGPLAVVEIGQQVVYFGLAVALAAAGFGIWSFAIAAVVQSLFATVVINAAYGHWLGLRFDWSIARRLWGFGIGYQFGNALAWARDAVVPVLGGLAGGLDAIGYLGFAWRNGQLVTAVEQIVQRVGFPAFSRLQRDPMRQSEMTRSSIELVVLAVATIQGWIFATAPILVPIIFTAQWTPAVVALQIVCVGSIANAPTYVLRALVYARGDSQRALVLSAVALAVLLVAFPILALSSGLEGAALAFALSAYTGFALFVRATRTTVAFPWASVARILVVVGAASLVGWAVALAVPTLAGLFLSGVLYLAAVAGFGAVLDRPLAIRLVRLVPARR